MTMERILLSGILFIILLHLLLLSLSFSGKHAVSGFSLPSGDSLAAVGRCHHHHTHVNVNINNNNNRGCYHSRSMIQRMASMSSDGSSSSSSSSTGKDGRISELATTTPPTPNTIQNETTILSKAPSLNGKIVLPVKVIVAGLRGHDRVAAVYALLNSNYTRGSGEGWEHVMHIGITKDLANDIAYFTSLKGMEAVAHVRALSFSYPQKAIMTEFANGWRHKVNTARERQGGGGEDEKEEEEARMMGSNNDEDDVLGWGRVPMVLDQNNIDTNKLVGKDVVVDDDDDDDDDDDMDEDDLDDYLQMMAVSRAAVSSSPSAASTTISPAYSSPPPLFVDNTGLTNIISLKNKNENPKNVIISPFESTNNAATKQEPSTPTLNDNDDDDGELLTLLELGIENVDKVLDEVRPYLISDGGNVGVQSVDTTTGNVYLQLEGACGSCASSTVTMKMGIERVLREKFGDRLGEVIQVVESGGGEGGGSKPSELTIEAVQAEVSRMSAAITAMGGVVRVVTVDPIGVVEIEFRGPNRVKKGIELALLDVEFVKHVKFVS